jgi:translation initiation factor 3 subunit H
MAAALAASLPAPTQQRVATPQPAAPTKVPQRMEGVVDVEAAREVETVQLNSLVRAAFHRLV